MISQRRDPHVPKLAGNADVVSGVSSIYSHGEIDSTVSYHINEVSKLASRPIIDFQDERRYLQTVSISIAIAVAFLG